MSTVTFVYATLAALAFGFQIATATVLFRTYHRTRSIGFLWLAIAAVVWPILFQSPQRIMRLLHLFNLVESGTITLAALTVFVFYLKYLISASVLMAAITYLCKTRQMISN